MDLVNEKKEEIFNTATYLFSKKGYMSTSVQDIAKACNISKATIYKCFNSKEDILIYIIKYFNNQMVRLVDEVNLNDRLSPIERYEEKIYTLFNYFSEGREFFLMLSENGAVMKEENIKSIILDNKAYIINELKDMLIQAYGESIRSIVWDITICLKGIIREFIVLFAIREISNKDYRDVSNFIVRLTTSIVDKHKDDKPLISKDIAQAFIINNKFDLDLEYLKKQWKLQILKLRSIVLNSYSIINREKILEAINLLEIEGEKENSNKVIIEALIMYISDNDELKEHAKCLGHVWNGIRTKG